MFLFNLLEGETSSLPMIIIIGVVILFMVVSTIMNNKKRKKQMAEEQERKDRLCKGTKIITIGGIIGTVVSVDHENSTFILETEGSKIKFDKRAIYQMDLPESAKVEEKVEETKAE